MVTVSILPNKTSGAASTERHDTLMNPAVMPMQNGERPSEFFQANNNIKCTSGGCCNLKTGRVKIGGSPCTPSKHECYVDVGTCNGYEYKCPRKAAPENTKCSVGFCKSGVCTAEKSDVVSTAKAAAVAAMVAAEEGAEALSEETAARQEEIDERIRELEAKISEAQEQQKKIQQRVKENRRISAKRLMKTAIDDLYKYTKNEHELGVRSMYPYKVTATREQALDNAASDFNLHDYVKQMTVERQKREAATMKMAASHLASTNAKAAIPWQMLIIAVLAVVAIAIIVAIVMVAKSGGKKPKSDEDYDNF
jgi:phosphoglycolate phosphatase-like HAD superfamily hydrolase